MTTTAEYPHEAVTRATAPSLRWHFTAMASEINMWVVNAAPHADAALQAAEGAMRGVERSCTRFDANSSLMRANRAGDNWFVVDHECFEAISAAADAHRQTAGRFDPRVLRVLLSQGYDRTLPFAAGPVNVEPEAGEASPDNQKGKLTTSWEPGLDHAIDAVRVGPIPIDLGGIGKSFAVRLAAAQLAGAGSAVLVEAGGDCAAIGAGPDGTGWRIGIEDPLGSPEPVAVINLKDRACATSSIRLRQWKLGERKVHHLIDPRTGEPGGEGLLAVTVVADDPMCAEVWSKTLFLAGVDGIAELADSRGLAALWVREDGSRGRTRSMADHLIWERCDD